MIHNGAINIYALDITSMNSVRYDGISAEKTEMYSPEKSSNSVHSPRPK